MTSLRSRRLPARAEKPAAGWTAYFVELTYDTGAPRPVKYTTQVVVTPDVLPFKWEDAAKKYPAKVGG